MTEQYMNEGAAGRMRALCTVSAALFLCAALPAVAGESADVKAVGHITDTAELARLALESEKPMLRRAAAEKLEDQVMLAEIALNDASWGVRRAAAAGLENQEVLARIALQDPHWTVRRAAVRNLTDQQALAEVALKESYRRIRRDAVKKLSDQEVLAELAIRDQDSQIRRKAAGKITDASLMAKVAETALHDEDWRIRRDAVMSLSDMSMLAEAAVSDDVAEVRLAAVERLTGPELLAGIAAGDEDPRVRRSAVGKVTDQALLAKLALEDRDWGVRFAAFSAITDGGVMTKTAEAAADGDYYATVSRIDFEPVIDGDISGWRDASPIVLDTENDVFPEGARERWNGPHDLSIRLYTGWDEDNFYIAAAVRDDRHHNTQTGSSIWNGDALQFAVVPDALMADAFNLGLALAGGHVRTYQWDGPDTDLFAGSEYAVLRDDVIEKTYYELKIPFERLGMEPGAGTVFGFNAVVLDDDDGTGFDFWMQITPGIAGGWAPQEFKKFIMID